MGGENFYIYLWAFTFCFSVFMMTIVPVVIMPIFNTYEPLKDGKLKTAIYELAGRLSYPLKNLFVMDGSKRSSHSNAFMFGFGSNKRIGECYPMMTMC
jgi:STE24 endopeptidase